MNMISSNAAAWVRMLPGRKTLHTNPLAAPPGDPAGAVWGCLGRYLGGVTLALLMAVVLVGAGCKTAEVSTLTEEDTRPFLAVGVQPGDVLRINFPAAPSMNAVQQVQPDGTIALPLAGTLAVKGKSPAAIEKEVLKAYDAQLVVKEVSISVESIGFSVFVQGAVLRPGKVPCRQSMTVLEAISEAGGFAEGRANLKSIKVVRQQEDQSTRTFVLDLQKTLRGEAAQPFYLRPSDVVYVPERFAFY